MTRRLLLILTVILAQSIPATAESREKDLDRWLDRQLVPYVQQQLLLHPRFKNETVMFVVLNENAPAPMSNALALSLRDRLLEASLDSAGVSVGWRQGRSGTSFASRPDDCLHDQVHYYIGLEVSQTLDSRYTVNVRALDLEDRTWVTGFGKQWTGRLNTVQRQALRQERVDLTFLGAREVPFTLDQTDLLAAQLAHQLSCTLKQQMEEDYVVSRDGDTAANGELSGTVELITNNLASRQALILSNDATQTNAVLTAKAHPIDGVLHQYWLTVSPRPEHADLPALSASAYVVLPAAARPSGFAAASGTPADLSPVREELTEAPAARFEKPYAISIPNQGQDGLLGPLSVASPRSPGDCVWPCSLLQAPAHKDAIVFFLEHQANHGLVRLANQECRKRTVARVARKGDTLHFPVAKTSTNSSDWTESYEWSLDTDTDTFFALAATDADVARKLANHLDALPLRCGTSLRPGLQGSALQAWLTELAAITASSSRYVDWRAVKVRDLT